MSGNRSERWAGGAGLLFVAALIASFFVPSTPDAGVADAALGPAIDADAQGLRAGVYLLGFAAAAFVVFAAGLAGRLRRGEGEQAGSSIVVVAGALVFSTLMLVASGVTMALTVAASESRDPAAVRALFELDEVVFIPAGFGLALMLLAAGAGIVGSRMLPAWLGWSALVLGAGFLVSLLGVMSEDDEGGPLGLVFFVDLTVSILWVAATSVALLREPSRAGAPSGRRVAVESA
jgi:hypothetical protein